MHDPSSCAALACDSGKLENGGAYFYMPRRVLQLTLDSLDDAPRVVQQSLRLQALFINETRLAAEHAATTMIGTL